MAGAPAVPGQGGRKEGVIFEGRRLFVRDPSILDGLRRRQKPGRCANCGRKLKGRQRIWCGSSCNQAAYDKSVLYDWDETRTKVLERDRYTCQRCGRGPLSASRTWTAEGKANWAEVDHVVPVSEAPEKQYDLSNLRTMCHPCHVETTKERRKATAIVETAAERAEALKPEDGTKNAESVLQTGKTPKRIADQVRADLIQNMRIEDVARKHQVNLQVVKGLWSALMATGIIPKGTRAGEVPQAAQAAAIQQPTTQVPAVKAPEPPPTPQPQVRDPSPIFQGQPNAGQGWRQPQPSQPQETRQDQQPYFNPYQPQPQSQSQSQPLVVSPPPGYDVRRQNGGAADERPAGRFPLTLEATGFVTKVYMNPKNIFWFDLWRKQHPDWQGDFADFISESIDFVFKTAGWELVARKTQRVA